MAAKRGAIAYTFRELPRGGEVRITTADPEAVRAIHAFLAFQRTDHRAPGHEHAH
jgi:TusA-related sulfurtransferase